MLLYFEGKLWEALKRMQVISRANMHKALGSNPQTGKEAHNAGLKYQGYVFPLNLILRLSHLLHGVSHF